MLSPRQNQVLVFALLRAVTVLVLAILAFILLFIFVKGIGTAIQPNFLTDYPRDGMREGGIFPAIMGTLMLTLLSIAACSVIGIPAGIYLSEYVPKSRFKSLIDIMTNNLAGIPSIVFGLFGMTLFVVGLGFGDSLLAGSLTLAIMVLPVVIRTTEESLRSVPQDIRIASIGMGATQYQTIVRVVLPAALPRILTGVILAIGRVAGETAPILFTVAALYLPRLPGSLFDQVMALPYHLFILSVSSPDPERSLPKAFGTALILLLIVLGMNLLAGRLRRYYGKKYRIQ
jgi:phosphate transport system permease protein